LARLLAHRNTLPLCLSYSPNSCAFYFCITWLPTFLEEKNGFKTASLAVLSGLPFVAAVAGDLFGGAATDWAKRRFGLRLGRAGVSGLGNLLAGVAMIGARWGTRLDIGRAHVGVVSSVFGPTLMTPRLARTGDWKTPVFVNGTVLLADAACRLVIDPREKVLE
jgi:sugar phosphate permease